LVLLLLVLARALYNLGSNNLDLKSVTYGNGLFVAVGGRGAIFISPYGADWTKLNSPTRNFLYGVAYGNNTFVVVGDGGTILTSPDGVNWTKQASGTSRNLHGVTYDNGTFVAVGGTILTSP
jgi:photosystem II stability/assembly factor-like uncharacterized protein